MARTRNVFLPFFAVTVLGERQRLNFEPLSEHWKVESRSSEEKLNFALAASVLLSGRFLILVCGGLLSGLTGGRVGGFGGNTGGVTGGSTGGVTGGSTGVVEMSSVAAATVAKPEDTFVNRNVHSPTRFAVPANEGVIDVGGIGAAAPSPPLFVLR
jgi:hypothetical protein